MRFLPFQEASAAKESRWFVLGTASALKKNIASNRVTRRQAKVSPTWRTPRLPGTDLVTSFLSLFLPKLTSQIWPKMISSYFCVPKWAICLKGSRPRHAFRCSRRTGRWPCPCSRRTLAQRTFGSAPASWAGTGSRRSRGCWRGAAKKRGSASDPSNYP